MTQIDEGRLFAAVRSIKGKPLTQADVDLVHKAMAAEVQTAVAGMRASPALVAHLHGFETCRLRAYPDPGSKDGKPWTIGWGSTGPDIGPNTVWTQEQCDSRFFADLARFEVGVNLLLQGKPTTQAQFDALVSFAYNVGLDIDDDTKAEGLGDSTLLKKHLAGDFGTYDPKTNTGTGAAGQFAAWNKNDGKVMNGLVRRRAAEAAMYVS